MLGSTWESSGINLGSAPVHSGPAKKGREENLTSWKKQRKHATVRFSPLRTSPDQMGLGHTHNLKVIGSNPTPATKEAPENIDVFGNFSIARIGELVVWQTISKHFDSQFSCQETQRTRQVRDLRLSARNRITTIGTCSSPAEVRERLAGFRRLRPFRPCRDVVSSVRPAEPARATARTGQMVGPRRSSRTAAREGRPAPTPAGPSKSIQGERRGRGAPVRRHAADRGG